MQAVVTGVPGSGKSFFMVNYLKKYFNYDDFYHEFLIIENYLIISNIDGLRVPHLKLDSPEVLGNPDEGIEGKFTREQFFTVKNFEHLMKIKRVSNIILAVDEAQKDWLFPLGYKDPDVLFFFQYHRHIGVHILLGTQHANLISRSILVLSEYIANATPRSKSVIGNFSYKFTDIKGNFLYSKVLRKDKQVFRAYKSMTVDEIEKPKNILLHWAVIAVAFLLIGGLCFKTALGAIKSKSQKAAPVQNSASIPAGAKLTHGQFSSNHSSVVSPSVLAFSSVSSAIIPKTVQSLSVGLPGQSMKNTESGSNDPVTVIGIYKADKTTHYMLSDGQSVQTKKLLKYGDIVQIKPRVVIL